MNLVIPIWLLWAALNFVVILLIVGSGLHFWLRRHRQHTADMQLVIDRCNELQTRLADLATFWLVGRHVRGNHWDVQGIFASRAEAIAACKNVRYFIFPLDLGVSLPEESTTPFKLEYPKEAE